MSGAELIQRERQRQLNEEGWSAEHDLEHDLGTLAKAALCYLSEAVQRLTAPAPEPWPWHQLWWKPELPIRELVKAGALIAAELDRIASEAERERKELGEDGQP